MPEPPVEIDGTALDVMRAIQESRGRGTWTPEDLRRYLMALAWNTPDKDYCLERRLFPQEISPGKVFHSTLNEMRGALIRDGKTRWATIGIAGQGEELVISPRVVEEPDAYKGLTLGEEVKADLYFFQRFEKMLEERGVLKELGDISCEPSYKNSHVFGVAMARGSVVAALATPTENIFVFRSTETKHHPLSGAQEMLETGQTVTELFTKLDSLSTEAFIEQNQLVFYQGKLNGPLIRTYPPVTS